LFGARFESEQDRDAAQHAALILPHRIAARWRAIQYGRGGVFRVFERVFSFIICLGKRVFFRTGIGNILQRISVREQREEDSRADLFKGWGGMFYD
jgi:hypothetical protein